MCGNELSFSSSHVYPPVAVEPFAQRVALSIIAIIALRGHGGYQTKFWRRAHQFRATFVRGCGSAEPPASAAGTERRPSAAAPRIPMLAISISAVKAQIAPRAQSTARPNRAKSIAAIV